VMEHITTKDAVDFISSVPEGTKSSEPLDPWPKVWNRKFIGPLVKSTCIYIFFQILEIMALCNSWCLLDRESCAVVTLLVLGLVCRNSCCYSDSPTSFAEQKCYFPRGTSTSQLLPSCAQARASPCVWSILLTFQSHSSISAWVVHASVPRELHP
jgi:hypothetical protein